MKIWPIILSIFMAFAAKGQSKRDAFMFLGGSSKDVAVSGMEMSFSSDSAWVKLAEKNHTTVHAVANSEAGKPLFYYNFCNIHNMNTDVMENGQRVNNGSYAWDNDCKKYGNDLVRRSGSLIIPDVIDTNLYYLFHIMYIHVPPATTSLINKIHYAKIDMSKNNGLGKVVEREKLIKKDSLHDAIAAVRHGNGRDWWIIVPRGTGREFWEFKLTPNGVSSPVLISIPKPWPPACDSLYEYARESWGAQARFTPDGTKYLRYSRGNGAEIYDFDRCSGALTLRRMFPEPPSADPDLYPVICGGICASPDSKLMYFDNREFLFQVDLSDSTINNPNYSPLLIYQWIPPDTIPKINSLFLMRNGHDGKIYINSPNSPESLHVINYPNKMGLDCGFVDGGFILPTYNAWIWADFPNFNLGKLPQSDCDTLISANNEIADEASSNQNIKITPNPANEDVQVWIPETQKGFLEIFNSAGVFIESHLFSNGNFVENINTRNWPSGVYFFKYTCENRNNRQFKRVLVLH